MGKKGMLRRGIQPEVEHAPGKNPRSKKQKKQKLVMIPNIFGRTTALVPG